MAEDIAVYGRVFDRSADHGHMTDRIWAKQAVRRTACNSDTGSKRRHPAGGGQVGAEAMVAGGVPGTAVDRFTEYAAAQQPPIGCGPVVLQVLVHQDRWDRDDPDRAVGAVLETAWCVGRAGALPT
jgi:hypothetical protein